MFQTGFKSKNDDKDCFESFAKKVILEMKNNSNMTNISDSTDVSIFIQTLYKDFQQHDFEEYEIVFLNLISAVLLIDEYFYQVKIYFLLLTLIHILMICQYLK